MRLTNISKNLLLSGAIAIAATSAAACGGTTGGRCTGTTGTTGTTDSGTDSGNTDAGQDAGITAPPAHLRIAHLAFGNGVGDVHLCASDGTSAPPLLVTSDALITGNFQGATVANPIPPGTITKHFDVPSSVTAILGGRTIDVYSAAAITTPISGGVGACIIPSGVLPLASATLGGTSPSAIHLVPGGYATVAVVGRSGTDTTGFCATANAACPAGVSILTLVDEVTATGANARVRVVNADPINVAVGACAQNTAVGGYNTIHTGVVPYVGIYPAHYQDVAPMVPVSPAAPYTLAINGSGFGPSGANLCGTPGTPNGTIPAQTTTTNAFFLGATRGAGTLRTSIAAATTSTIFIMPSTIQFRDQSMITRPPCAPGSSAMCLPSTPILDLTQSPPTPSASCTAESATCKTVSETCADTSMTGCVRVTGMIAIQDGP